MELNLREIRKKKGMTQNELALAVGKTYAGWSSIEPAKIYIHDDLSKVAQAVSCAWS